jgi:hypothetical protein
MDRGACCLKHVFGEVNEAIPGRFGPDETATPPDAFPGKHSGKFVFEFLVGAKQVADFSPAYANISRGDIGAMINVARKFSHEGMTKAHDFIFTLSLRVEIASSLAAPHGNAGEGILEDLLEGQEFEYALVD